MVPVCDCKLEVLNFGCSQALDQQSEVSTADGVGRQSCVAVMTCLQNHQQDADCYSQTQIQSPQPVLPVMRCALKHVKSMI